MDIETSRQHDFVQPLVLIAPLSGPVVPIEQVPDPVFAQKLVGDGIAIDPVSQTLLAPCAGKIVQLHPSRHALTIQTLSGVQVLLHIGIDTVTLKGEGFTARVKEGDTVTVGQPLIDFDADLIARKARSLLTMIVIADAPAAHELANTHARRVQAGQETLMTITFGAATSRPASMTAAVKSGATHSLKETASSNLITIRLATGLHARPAAQLVSKTKAFTADVKLWNDKKSANAKSVVGILGLEISSGQRVHFTAEGADAERAVSELEKFLAAFEEHADPATQPKTETPARAAVTRGDANTVTGVGASPGIAIGRVFQLRAEEFAITEKATGNLAYEKSALTMALRKASEELAVLGQSVKDKTDASQAAIFAAHQELLDDPDLIQDAMKWLDQGQSAAFAWKQAFTAHAERLASLNNELLANRANDLRDIGNRVLRILVGATPRTLAPTGSGLILIAENLTPSDTAQLDREKVLGFCTTTGGSTSHVAILARSLGLPALAGIEARALQIADGTEVVIDGDRGELRLNPSVNEKQTVETQQKANETKRQAALSSSKTAAVTRDGRMIEVAANIGGVADAKQAVEMGCDGVGLLRSEFLFLDRATAPSEDEQFQVYQEIANILGDRPLVIRTLDVGGDKPLRYLPIPAEENPFLGVRGIRVGFLMPEILREQLRAILRVKSPGKLHIMFPMIATLEEFRQAKQMLEEERIKLGVAPVSVGIMIEVPSAALMAEVFAREADFFSIGTNDLTQYTLAMDRGHKDLARQVDSLHPTVLKLIEMTVKAAHQHGKWVGVCGGIAGDPKAVGILLGLGVDELSVSIPVVPLVKSQIRESSLSDAQKLAGRAVLASTATEVREMVQFKS